MVHPLSYFSFQPVVHEWRNKGRSMCYPVCGMVHIKEPLLLIGNSSPCGGSGFPLSLSEWSFTIYPTPYNRKKHMLSVSLNKTFPSFLPDLTYKYNNVLLSELLNPVEGHLQFSCRVGHHHRPHVWQLRRVHAAHSDSHLHEGSAQV